MHDGPSVDQKLPPHLQCPTEYMTRIAVPSTTPITVADSMEPTGVRLQHNKDHSKPRIQENKHDSKSRIHKNMDDSESRIHENNDRFERRVRRNMVVVLPGLSTSRGAISNSYIRRLASNVGIASSFVHYCDGAIVGPNMS